MCTVLEKIVLRLRKYEFTLLKTSYTVNTEGADAVFLNVGQYLLKQVAFYFMVLH